MSSSVPKTFGTFEVNRTDLTRLSDYFKCRPQLYGKWYKMSRSETECKTAVIVVSELFACGTQSYQCVRVKFRRNSHEYRLNMNIDCA